MTSPEFAEYHQLDLSLYHVDRGAAFCLALFEAQIPPARNSIFSLHRGPRGFLFSLKIAAVDPMSNHEPRFPQIEGGSGFCISSAPDLTWLMVVTIGKNLN